MPWILYTPQTVPIPDIQVGRIHQKVLLDEDQAEIRLFQER